MAIMLRKNKYHFGGKKANQPNEGKGKRIGVLRWVSLSILLLFQLFC